MKRGKRIIKREITMFPRRRKPVFKQKIDVKKKFRQCGIECNKR